MIESNIIEWLNFGDSIQTLDIYSKSKYILFFGFFRALIQNKNLPVYIDIIFMSISFFQLWTMSIIHVQSEEDIILEIINYVKKVTTLSEIITNSPTYKIIFHITISIILIDTLLIIISFIIIKHMNISIILFIINCFNLIIYYYLVGPIIEISLSSVLCENNTHKYLQIKCFTNSTHLLIFVASFIMMLLYIFISFIYSIYCNRIGRIVSNLNESTVRINCNYELFLLITKIIIFAFSFLVKTQGDKLVYKIIYESFIIFVFLIMSIYVYKNVYYYNEIINKVNFYGWLISVWLSFCALLKIILNIKNISIIILIGCIFIIISFNKLFQMKEYSLITEINLFEFRNIRSIEIYKNILLKVLNKINDNKYNLLLSGIIKKLEDYINNNPEINYHYHKLLNDENLGKKVEKTKLQILSIIYTLYSFYLEKLTNKEEISIYLSYFLINNFQNISFAIHLCSRYKSKIHKCLYYKYVLTEDIKEYLIFKLNKKSLSSHPIKHIQLSNIILYYLYIDLLKIKIFDSICIQIDYLDLLYNNVVKNKLVQNFLKYGENILKYRHEIMFIWEKITQLNPFSDQCQKDYMLYLDYIIQDEFLSKEEAKKYKFMKDKKIKEKDNTYHTMFIYETSSIILVDGYSSIGKILYASPNFPFVFVYNEKDILNLSIDDLLPNVIQVFHKELINDAMKYKNIKNIFSKPIDSLLKNKNGGIFKIKLFVKPVPNLSYGLIYFNYLQKIYDNKFVIILDKDLKINGFSSIDSSGSPFILNNDFNLDNKIIGYHIGIIIPDILFLLNYENEEFTVIEKNNELKGNFYYVDDLREIKDKLDNTLEKIKSNKSNKNNYQAQAEDNKEDISDDLNEIIKEINKKSAKSFNIFYRIKLYSFIEGKYKYYRVYVYHNYLTLKDIDLPKNNLNNTKIKEDYNKFSSKISKVKKIAKIIQIENKVNNEEPKIPKIADENNINNINNDLKSDEVKNKEESNNNNNNNEKKSKSSINSLKLYNSQPDNGFNKTKNDILKKKEILPIKIMKYLYYIFDVIVIFLMVYELFLQKQEFFELSEFLEQDLYFNQTKISIGAFYSISVSFRWLSHSLYINNVKCPENNWVEYFKLAFLDNVDYIESQRNLSLYLRKEFKEVLDQRRLIELYIYKRDEKEKYNFHFSNYLTFIFNSGIKIIDEFKYFTNVSECKEIPKELGYNEIYLQNLIDELYKLFFSGINGFKGKEKEKKISKIMSEYPISLLISGITLFLVMFFYIYQILNLHNIEMRFLEKLINFNSPNFDKYIKNLNELKNKLKNDNINNNSEDEKIDYDGIDSNKNDEKIEEENGKKEVKYSEKVKKQKQNKAQIKKKKIQLITKFFKNNNYFMIVKIFLTAFFSLTYYIIMLLMKTKNKNRYIVFESINDSIDTVIKQVFDLFLPIKREVEEYEKKLINCQTLDGFYNMTLPKIKDMKIPNFGNLVLDLIDDNDFNEETKKNFQLLFNQNLCLNLTKNEKGLTYCNEFWSGILKEGLGQAIIQLGVIISESIDELNSLNEQSNNRTLMSLINKSSFFQFELFCEYYLRKTYKYIGSSFKLLREAKLNAINNEMQFILIIYLIISIFLFILLFYFIYSYKNVFNSFIYFVGIIPHKYISEDKNFYREVTRFGSRYYL